MRVRTGQFRLDALLIRRKQTTRHKTEERNWNRPRQVEENLSYLHTPVTRTQIVFCSPGGISPPGFSWRFSTLCFHINPFFRMNHHFDVIIIGAGIMGSAAAAQLARRGRKVLLLDQFTPPHANGSSHGESRVIREAYFEHPAYVPLIQRAYELWQELEQESGGSLLKITGGLMIGPENGAVFGGSRRSAEEHKLPHEILTAEQVNARFPAFNMPEDFLAVHEPRAGMLFAEKCHQALLDEASAHGVVFRWNETVESWTASDQHVEVTTRTGRYQAEQLVIAAGPWAGQIVSALQGRLTVERQVMHWFDPAARLADFVPDSFPVHVWEYEHGKYFYALPDAGSGVKTAIHHQGEITSVSTVNRTVTEDDKLVMQQLVAKFLPSLNRPPHRSAVCLYTNTADEHFLVDWHPEFQNVLMMSPCSGHGFKFAPALGEIAADLLTNGKSRFDIALFGYGQPRWESDPPG